MMRGTHSTCARAQSPCVSQHLIFRRNKPQRVFGAFGERSTGAHAASAAWDASAKCTWLTQKSARRRSTAGGTPMRAASSAAGHSGASCAAAAGAVSRSRRGAPAALRQRA